MGGEATYSSLQIRPHKGGWRAQLKYKDGERWRQKTKVLAAKGKREAMREADAWREEMEEAASYARGLGPKRPKDAPELVSRYVETLAGSQAVELSTLRQYRSTLKYITAAFHGVSAEDLDLDTAQAWVNEMAKTYSPSTVRKAANLLKAAYRDAVERRAIRYSPVAAVKTPKLPRREPNALDEHARARLVSYLDIAASTPTNTAIKLALFLGMREGEICGLRWRDVDLRNKVLHVRTVIGRDGGHCYVKEPKTGGSRRDIPLPPSIADALTIRRADMAGECMGAGVAMAPTLYVFGGIDGAYMNPHTLWVEWRAIAESLGLVGTEGRPPTFHDLRHTFATTAIASGADVKSVSSIMGHANAAMTLNVYASADAEAKRRTMESTARALDETPREAKILQLRPTGTEG